MEQADTSLPLRVRATTTTSRVSRELLAFAKCSFGPLGRTTLLQLNARCADALVLTSTAGRFFQHVKCVKSASPAATKTFATMRLPSLTQRLVLTRYSVGTCPVANAYFQMLCSHARSHSDAGLVLTIVTTSLQLEIQDGVLADIPRYALLRGALLHVLTVVNCQAVDNQARQAGVS